MEFLAVETLHARIAKPGGAIALTVLIVAAALGLAGLLVWQSYQSALTASESRAQSAADIVGAHLEWMIEASDQALRRIDTAIGDGPIGTTPDAVEDISQAVGDLPEGFQYSVYDQAGVLRLSSISHAGGIRIDDRDYYQQLKAGARMVVSPHLIEKLSHKPSFIIARRLDRKGVFYGVATIAIPTAKMDDFWTSIGLGPLSTVSVVRADGWVVARHPELHAPLNIAKSPLFALLPNSPKGTYYNQVSPADGLSRIIGYRKIARWPLVALSGIERGEAMASFWRTLELQVAFGLPLLLLLVGFTIWVAWLLQAFAARNLALEQAMERNRFLFREIHHRVKNNLQAVSSLIRLQPLPDVVRNDMARRIAAMVAVHEHIYQSDQFDRVELVPYLERLIGEIARSYPQDVAVDLRLEAVTVDRDMVLPIGMIVNEVVSNAFKYAFSGNSGDGRLVVELARGEDGRAVLKIADNGPGMISDAKKGMGSRLINGFVGQIGSEYRFESGDGLVFVLLFPMRLGEERRPSAAVTP
jgi:two-component sensor histidine kinase